MSEIGLRVMSGLGFVVLLGVAWLVSSDRSAINLRAIATGIVIQIGLAVLLLATPIGEWFFLFVEVPVAVLIETTQSGVQFVFGPLATVGNSFALSVLPVVVFMGSLFSIFYYCSASSTTSVGYNRWYTDWQESWLARCTSPAPKHSRQSRMSSWG